MIEHRLIERMLELARKEVCSITQWKRADVVFLDQAVDFIKTYADRTHHGKEEDILFRDLEKRPLSPGHRKMMQDLVNEHKFARGIVAEMVAARQRYMAGDAQAVEVIKVKLQALADFYPVHIAKEDKEFFPATERYYNSSELDAMLQEFREFDRKMIHDKYKAVVQQLEDKRRDMTCSP